MRLPAERVPFDAVVSTAIAATVVAFACGSSSVAQLNSAGKPARWALLLVLAALAAVWAWTRRGRTALTPLVAAAAAVFVALGLLSAGWSVDPRLSFERAVTLALLLGTAALLAAAGAPGRVVAGVLAGVAAVALAGLVVLAVDRSAAVSPASYEVPSRYQGLGENPNTVPLLLALGVPLAVTVCAGGRRRRSVGVALLVLFVGSIVASGSRGALAAAAVGAVAAVLVTPLPRRTRLAAAAGAIAVAGVGAWIESLPKPAVARAPARASSTAAAQPKPQKQPRYLDVDNYYPLDADVGGPLPGGGQPTVRRSFLSSSGRLDAWTGAIHQATKRPLLGFGFGTEAKVFVDRYYYFVGGLPENSYIGLFLQLGAVGLVAFLALMAALALAAVRALRRPEGRIALSVLLSALVLALVQSYVYSVGNIGTVTFWICAFLGAAVVAPRAQV